MNLVDMAADILMLLNIKRVLYFSILNIYRQRDNFKV